MKFSCLIIDEPHNRRELIDYTPAVFKKFEAFSLALHLDPCNEGKYKVSDTTTGRALIGPQDTPEAALDICSKFLKTITPQQLGERIAYYLLGPGREEEPRT